MSYKLTFAPWTDTTPESATMFTNLYSAFLGSVENPNRAKSMEDMRNAIKVLDAFDAVSETTDAGGGREVRSLKKDGGVIELSDSPFRLLQGAVDTYVGQLPFAVARAGLKLKEWVDTAVKE